MSDNVSDPISPAMEIVDARARETAIDPTRSFCVSAPAGSGKTELLIQRYLGLLARVERPEQVLAITFTRKAAAEMRERVLQALQAALNGEPCANVHQRSTRLLAEQALAADSRGGWQLLRDINRMNIKTIDSFCGALTRQMPILSRFGGQARVVDDASEFYSEAALELFQQLDTDDPIAADLASLMLHFDNNWDRLQNLLIAMLSRRDQWQAYVGVHHSAAESEAYLLQSVESLVRDALSRLQATLAPYASELLRLQQFAANNLDATVPLREPAAEPRDMPLWRSLRNLLLTKEGGWRKSLNKTMGFPTGKGEPQQRKDQLKAIIAELSQIDGLQDALMAVTYLPEIGTGSASWQLVLHLSRILPLLEAHLLLTFARHGAVDHSQVALSALQALGDDEAPTELALRLDYQLEHILVDEFQDTAINQYELLRRLTRGWGQHNAQNPQRPRTLMIVGDGMQSIYGFRDANVGLFLKAREEGFNGVELQHLLLQSNFRSDEGIVDWVNQTFAWAFPAEDDISRGQVSFSAATAVRPQRAVPAVNMHAFEGEQARAQEVAFVCDQIALACADPECKSLAVLGRSRGHLQPLITGLKQRGIDYAAQDMDSLASSPLVTDLLSLCRALNNPADRLAWMALLRAPWCGLTLSDLLVIGRWGESPRYTPLYLALHNSELRQQLSRDGNARLDRILPSLQQAMQTRERRALRVWLEQLWVGLGGPATARDENQLEDAESFFELLEQAEQEGPGLDPDWLELQLQKRYTNAGNPHSKIQLMTLHKAKGLEFDRVIIPQLGRTPRVESRQILLWDEHYNADGQRSFLLAADDHCEAGSPTLYNYLQIRRQEKALLETTRLLYVGVTRAISQLLLTASLGRDGNSESFRVPSRRSLLSPIWLTFEQQMTVHEPAGEPEVEESPLPSTGTLMRLCGESISAPLAVSGTEPVMAVAVAAAADADADANIPNFAGNHLERYVGTVVHQALEELSLRDILPQAVEPEDRQRWQLALAELGLWGQSLQHAIALVEQSVNTSLAADGTGRWILSSEHPQARSEWALSTVDALGRVQDLVIDRSFVDKQSGTRWIIDYKNSRPEPGQALEDFLSQQGEMYRDQLLRYRDGLHALTGNALCCALYFTALGLLHRLPELDLPKPDTQATE
jgi:ATP-dependent helicase/nuclease subunit A